MATRVGYVFQVQQRKDRKNRTSSKVPLLPSGLFRGPEVVWEKSSVEIHPCVSRCELPTCATSQRESRSWRNRKEVPTAPSTIVTTFPREVNDYRSAIRTLRDYRDLQFKTRNLFPWHSAPSRLQRVVSLGPAG